MEQKLYQHNCEDCIFLGVYDGYDLYFAEQSIGGPTVIARYGNDDPDYISGLIFSYPYTNAVTNERDISLPLWKARKLAEEKGLM